MVRFQQSDKESYHCDPHSKPLRVAAEIGIRLREKSLKEETDHEQRDAEEDKRKPNFPYEVKGKAVEEISPSFMRFLALFVKAVRISTIIYDEVYQQENSSQTNEAGQCRGHPAEIAGKVEERVDSFHGVGRGSLLEVFLNPPEVENADQKPQRQQPAEDRVDGVE